MHHAPSESWPDAWLPAKLSKPESSCGRFPESKVLICGVFAGNRLAGGDMEARLLRVRAGPDVYPETNVRNLIAW
jgi:hypothetical protein